MVKKESVKTKKYDKELKFLLGGLWRCVVVGLSIGLYLPWFLHYVLVYLVSSMEVDGRKVSLDAKATKLIPISLVYIVLSMGMSLLFPSTIFVSDLIGISLGLAAVPYMFSWASKRLVFSDTLEKFTPDSTSLWHYLKNKKDTKKLSN